MNIYTASEQQQNIINSKASLSNIAYADYKTALLTIANQSLQNLVMGYETTIVIPDEMYRQHLNTIFGQMGIDMMTHTFHLDDTVTDEDIANLHKAINAEPYKPNVGFDDNKYKYDHLLTKVINYYNKKYHSSLTDKSWREALDIYLRQKPDHHTNILFKNLNSDNFEFNANELAELKNTISEALMIYTRDHEISDQQQLNLLLHKNALNPEKLQDITHALFTFFEVASTLRDKFFDHFIRLENDYISETNQSIGRLQDEILLLSSKIDYHLQNKTKTSLLNIFSDEQKQKELTIKTLINEWNEKHQQLAEYLPISKNQDKNIPDDAVAILLKHNESLEELKIKRINRKKDFLKSINRFNINDHNITDLEYDLQALVNRINETEILNQKLEINTLSFAKQTDFIANLAYQLEVTLLKIQKNNQYYQWTSFLESCTLKEQNLFHELKFIDPKDWIHTFESWYYLCLLTKDNIHLDSAKEINFISLLQMQKNQRKTEIDALWSSYNHPIKQAWDQLKKSNEILYTAIKKNKKLQHPTKWKFLLGDNFDFFSKLFPIVMTDGDQLDQIKEQKNNKLIIFNKPNVNVEILQLFASITTYLDRDKFNGSHDYLLTQHQFDQDKILKELTVSDRLPLVRSLADILVSFGKMPEIYKMRNSSIISYASPYINQYFSSQLYSLGLKQIQIDTSIHESLLGALLDSDNMIYILTEDGLFDHHNLDFLMWQVKCLQKIKKIGCEILDVDTQQLMTNHTEVLWPMIELIISNQKSANYSNQKQISFEFN